LLIVQAAGSHSTAWPSLTQHGITAYEKAANDWQLFNSLKSCTREIVHIEVDTVQTWKLSPQR